MESPFKDIYWLSSPLAIKQRDWIGGVISKTFHTTAPGFLRPQNEHHISEYRFANQIKHWALEIDNVCYEIQPNSWKKLKAVKAFTDIATPSTEDAKVWKSLRDDNDIKYERWKVGVTRMSHHEIENRLHYIWERFNHDMYLFLVQNCQNFTKMLCESISVAYDDLDGPKDRSSWKQIPDPASYTIASTSQKTLQAGGMYSIVGWTQLTLASMAPTAEALETGAAATALGTGVGDAAATASASAGTGTTVSGAAAGQATSGTAAGQASLATAASGTMTTTTTTTSTSAAGTATSHSSAAAAGKTGLAGKSALGAKLGLGGQSIMHGAGAAKAATALKVGGVVAMAHPMVAVGALGLGVLAAGARDRGWIQKHRGELGKLNSRGIGVALDEKEYHQMRVADALAAEEEVARHHELGDHSDGEEISDDDADGMTRGGVDSEEHVV